MSVFDLVADHLDADDRRESWKTDPRAWVQDQLDEDLWSMQVRIMENVDRPGSRTAVPSCNGSGKALDLDTVLPTPTGWTTMAEVQVGDELLDEHGDPVRVTTKSAVQHRPTYRLTFDDRSELVASDDHQWQVIDLTSRPRGVLDWRDHWNATVTRTTAELAAEPLTVYRQQQYRWRIPTARPLHGAPIDLPIGGYTLGVWLGDGTSDQAAFICHNDDAPDLLAGLDADGTRWRVRPSAVRERSTSYGLLGVLDGLRDLGVFRNKHIPRQVFRADVATRLAVLQGLMDTDGFVVGTSQSVGIDLTNERLAADVAELAATFGWKTFRTTKPSTYYGRVVGTVYRLAFRPDLPVFRLTRKANKLGRTTAQAARHTVRTLVKIEQIETRPTQCVTVDSPTHLYLAGETLIPTHNSHLASRAVSRFIDIHPPGSAFVFTTAPRAQQVRAILWRYIRRAHKKGNLPGIVTQGMIPEWKIDGEIVGFGRKPADVDADTVMGIHEERLLIVLDEADGINASLWDSLESLMTNADSCSVLAIGNPVDNTSRFARMCDGTEPGWDVFRISAYDTPLFTGEPVTPAMAKTLVQPGWAADKEKRWGRSSPLFIAKVLGQHPDAADGLIPASWVIAAQARWETWFNSWDGHGYGSYEACRDALWRGGTVEPPGSRLISCDVATEGEDATAIATKQGDIVMGVERWQGIDIPQIVELMKARLTHVGAAGVVDANGEGAGVYQVMRHAHPVEPFKGSYATKARDSGGVLKFPNWRVASWYHLRELLNPLLGATLALPPDDELLADLTTPKYGSRTGGVVWVEDKDDIRKRLGRSVDLGDAVAMACWSDQVGVPDDAPTERPAVRRWSSTEPAEPAPRPDVPGAARARPRVRR